MPENLQLVAVGSIACLQQPIGTSLFTKWGAGRLTPMLLLLKADHESCPLMLL